MWNLSLRIRILEALTSWIYKLLFSSTRDGLLCLHNVSDVMLSLDQVVALKYLVAYDLWTYG